MITDKEVNDFITEHADEVNKVLVQEIKANFIYKKDGKLIWREAVMVRLQEIKEAKLQLLNELDIEDIGQLDISSKRDALLGAYE